MQLRLCWLLFGLGEPIEGFGDLIFQVETPSPLKTVKGVSTSFTWVNYSCLQGWTSLGDLRPSAWARPQEAGSVLGAASSQREGTGSRELCGGRCLELTGQKRFSVPLGNNFHDL